MLTTMFRMKLIKHDYSELVSFATVKREAKLNYKNPEGENEKPPKYIFRERFLNRLPLSMN